VREKNLLGEALGEQRHQGEDQQREGPAMPVKPSAELQMEHVLEAPRHLVWLFLRELSQLDEQEQRTLTFLRQDHRIEHRDDLAQSCRKMCAGTQCCCMRCLAASMYSLWYCRSGKFCSRLAKGLCRHQSFFNSSI